MKYYKYEELYTGQTESFTTVITGDMMIAFHGICKDENPMHMDEAYAKERGFDAKVVYGMLTSSFYSTLCGVYLPGERCLLHEISIKFIKPVYTGDTLKVIGEVVGMTDAYRRIEIKAKIYNQKNQMVSSANIKAGVRNE